MNDDLLSFSWPRQSARQRLGTLGLAGLPCIVPLGWPALLLPPPLRLLFARLLRVLFYPIRLWCNRPIGMIVALAHQYSGLSKRVLLANSHFAGVTPAIFVIFVDFWGPRNKIPCFCGQNAIVFNYYVTTSEQLR